jgi:uncharacterized membrane protein YqjE
MSETGTPPDAETAGVVRQFKAFLAACSQYASARLRLASMEGKEAAGEAAKILFIAGAALFLGVFGWLFACFAVIFLMAKAMGENGWIWASLIMAGVHFCLAVALGFALKARGAKAFFPLTTAEFEKDRVWLEKENK